MQHTHKYKIRITHSLPQEIRPVLLPQPLPHNRTRRPTLLPVLFRRRRPLDLVQFHAKSLLSRLVEVLGGPGVQEFDGHARNDKAGQGLRDLSDLVAHLGDDGVGEVQGWGRIPLLQLVRDGPRVGEVGAVWETQGGGGVV